MNILAHKALLATFNVSCWGARVFDEEAATDTLERNKALLEHGLFTKRLLRKEALQKVHRIANEARKFHRLHTHPWKYNGVGLLATALFGKYSQEMRRLSSEYQAAVGAFLANYPREIEAARESLGHLFDVTDYPTVEWLAGRFAFEIRFDQVPDHGDLRAELDDAELDEVRDELKRRMEDDYKRVRTQTAQRISETVGRMAERLKEYKPADKEKGTKAEHVFRDSLVQHVKDLVSLLPAFNMDNDPRLVKIQEQIEKKLCRFDADDLKESDVIRARVAKDAAAIAKAVSEFMA